VFNLLKQLFKRKPQIIPFSTYRNKRPECPKETPENKCKILPFKVNPNYAANGNRTGKCKIMSFEYRDLEYPDQCKLDFIWDHLL